MRCSCSCGFGHLPAPFPRGRPAAAPAPPSASARRFRYRSCFRFRGGAVVAQAQSGGGGGGGEGRRGQGGGAAARAARGGSRRRRWRAVLVRGGKRLYPFHRSDRWLTTNMVVFTCNACGESVKKAQVEKHVNICRNCQCLSCMDCGKDFWGDDYKEHVKCVSEDQKYGGKDFEAKTNKGDAKQQEWIQKIHEVMKKPNISPKVRNILEQMRVFDNIPRKKVKFQNWMKNSLRITDSTLQDQVWDIFSEATRNISSEKEDDKPQQKEERQSAETGEKTMGEENGITDDKIERKKNKRERKEERQKNTKKEKKDLKLENQSEVKKSKKSKKGKQSLANEFEINGNGHQHEMEEETNVKKRKHKHVEEEPHITTKRMKTENISEDMETQNTNGNEENVGTDKGKFNWKGTIKAVLKQAPDNEISIKKLRKKVIAQYYAVAGEHHKSEEDILVLFNKKVNNNPKFKVLKDKVKLLK